MSADRCGNASSNPTLRLRRIALLRHAVQFAVFGVLLAPLWWPLISRTAPFFRGNLAASQLTLGRLAIPLADPFATASVMFSSRTLPATMLAGAGIILAFYVLLRARAFCAWVCPLHLVLELWDRALTKLHLRREPIGARWPRWTSTAVALALLAAAALAEMPLWEPVNPINSLVRTLQHLSFSGLWLVGAVLLLEAVAGRRVFCRHVCPVGGFYSALNQPGLVGVALDTSACTHCRACTATCLAAPELEAVIERARDTRGAARLPVESPHCTFCLDCVAVCEHHGIALHRRHSPHLEPA